MKSSKYLLFAFIFVFFHSCDGKKNTIFKANKEVTILIQPFKDISPESIKFVLTKIKSIYPHVKLLEAIDLPKTSYYKARNRYRADSIIHFLSKNTKDGFVTVGLTTKDISTTKGAVKDFGIMGLGFQPGKSCVASSFRLKKNNKNEQLFKVALHEIGHTQGLKHCTEKACFMRDAEGKNLTDEEKDFCDNCKIKLKTKNWKFSE